MKKQALTAFMVLGLMITLAVTPGTAQSNSHSMRIRIPFEFTVKDKTLPPGEYVVKRNVSDRPEMLLISSVDGGPGKYVITKNAQARERQSDSKLVFQRYG